MLSIYDLYDPVARLGLATPILQLGINEKKVFSVYFGLALMYHRMGFVCDIATLYLCTVY